MNIESSAPLVEIRRLCRLVWDPPRAPQDLRTDLLTFAKRVEAEAVYFEDRWCKTDLLSIALLAATFASHVTAKPEDDPGPHAGSNGGPPAYEASALPAEL